MGLLSDWEKKLKSSLPSSAPGDMTLQNFETLAAGGAPDEYRRRKQKAHEKRETEANAPAVEMARRNAIPLMVDEAAIEAARRRALERQAQRSGRESTMLTGGNTGGLGG